MGHCIKSYLEFLFVVKGSACTELQALRDDICEKVEARFLNRTRTP